MSDVDLDDPNWERREYDKFAAYGSSKTANVLHMVELDRRLRDRGVRAYAVHPGVVATSLARHMTRDDFASLNNSTPADPDAADASMCAATSRCPNRARRPRCGRRSSPDLAGVGSVYLADCRDPRGRRAVRSWTMRTPRTLWELSERLCAQRRARLAIVNRMDRRKQEVRDRILGAAFDLFLDQGVSATTIEDICERADVANRTFFNHFATRHDMMRALAEERLLNLRDVVFDRGTNRSPPG